MAFIFVYVLIQKRDISHGFQGARDKDRRGWFGFGR